MRIMANMPDLEKEKFSKGWGFEQTDGRGLGMLTRNSERRRHRMARLDCGLWGCIELSKRGKRRGRTR